MPKLDLTEFSGDTLELPEWSGVFDAVVHQNQISDAERMRYLKISITSLMSQARPAMLGMGFTPQSYYLAWDVLFEGYGRSHATVSQRSVHKNT